MKIATSFFAEIWDKRYAVGQLVKRDLTERYLGTYLGFFWAIAQHVIMLGVMYFALQFGLRVHPAGDIPFIAWMVPALAVWAFFSEAVNTSSNALITYAYIVKKIQFKLSILPLIKVFSALVLHVIFLVIAILILLASGVRPSFYWLQVFYYGFAGFCLVLGLSWLLSAVMVFFRDLASGIAITLNVLMWLTPLYWNMETLPSKYRFLCYLNPVSYLSEGYRQSFLYDIPFWQQPLWACYFWFFTLSVMVAGIFVFKKLKHHFADVL